MKIRLLMSSMLLALSFSQPASATIIDNADVVGLKTFKDMQTGRVWLDINNFYDANSNNGMTGYAMIAAAQSAGFTIANRSDVSDLLGSLPIGNGEFSSYAAVMGYSVPRNLIWGMYDDNDANANFGYAFTYGGNWNIVDNVTNPSYIQNDGAEGAEDLGLWAYQTANVAQVPEPGSIALLGLGIAGLIASRRRKQA